MTLSEDYIEKALAGWAVKATGKAGRASRKIGREVNNPGSPTSLAVLGGASVAAGAGAAELRRRHYNRRGADISPTEGYRHPWLASYKRNSVEAEWAHDFMLRRAAKSDRKAATTTDPVKSERYRLAGDRRRGYANGAAFNAQAYHRAGRVGGLQVDHEVERNPYNPDTAYKLPDRPTRTKAKKPIRKSVLDAALSKAKLPGDNRDAEMARSRRVAGLGLATGGYLLASRAKDVAPAVADVITPKWANGAKHARRVAGRTKFISAASSKGGGAAVVGGLALAAEGAVNDLRYRKAFSRTRQDVREQRVRSQVRSSLKKAMDDEMAKGIGSFFSGAGSKIGGHATKLGGHLKPLGNSIGAAFKPAALAEGATKPTVAARFKPVGTAAVDAVKPIGAKIKNANYHPGTFSNPTKAGVAYAAGAGGLGAGLLLNKAFDSERDRHSRQNAYIGAAAGGATAATVGGIAAGVKARTARKVGRMEADIAANKHARLKSELRAASVHEVPPPVKAQAKTAIAPAVRGRTAAQQATEHAKTQRQVAASGTAHLDEIAEHRGAASAFAGRAKKLSRISRGSLAGAALLGTAAYGVHDYDRRRGGRSYGY